MEVKVLITQCTGGNFSHDIMTPFFTPTYPYHSSCMKISSPLYLSNHKTAVLVSLASTLSSSLQASGLSGCFIGEHMGHALIHLNGFILSQEQTVPSQSGVCRAPGLDRMALGLRVSGWIPISAYSMFVSVFVYLCVCVCVCMFVCVCLFFSVCMFICVLAIECVCVCVCLCVCKCLRV
jgi:hypothetical protein